LGAFFGSVATSSSANDTNITNNSSNKTNDTVSVGPMAVGWDPQVSISVTSSVNFGSQLPDGLESPYPSVTQVNVEASDSNLLVTETLQLYVRASGDLSSGNNKIPLNNLKYDGFSNSSLPKTSFTTSNTRIQSWPLERFLIWYYLSKSVNGNYYLTVPMGTNQGTYNTTIFYTAILV
jgi:hypothetical protein